MVEARHRLDGSQQRWAVIFDAWRRNDALRAAGPPLLFGLRLWASVCLALYVAFWLELDNPFWAGTSAAIVCQPHLGASLRKGWFRMIGTVVGAVAIVVLTACFPQDRAAVSRRSGAVGRRLRARRHASAQLRGLCGGAGRLHGGDHRSDKLGATGGPDAAGLHARRLSARARSASASSAPASFSPGPISAAPSAGWPRCSRACRPKSRAGLPARWRWPGQDCRRRSRSGASSSGGSLRSTRSSTRRSAKSSQLRYHSPVLQTAVDGLFAALAGWRTVAVHLARLPDDRARRRGGRPSCAACRRSCDRRRSTGEPTRWIADPVRLRRICEAAVRTLIALPAGTPSLRLLADQTAEGAGRHVARAQRAGAARRRSRSTRSWPSRRSGCACPIGCRLSSMPGARSSRSAPSSCSGSSPHGRAAPRPLPSPRSWSCCLRREPTRPTRPPWRFTLGTVLAAVFAAIVKFAVLPGLETFAGLQPRHRSLPGTGRLRWP